MRVDGSVTVQLTVPSGTPTTSTASPAPAAQVHNASPLPRTGSELISVLLLALALVCVGTLLLRATRLRGTP